MEFEISGKVALVTGGSSGFGYHIAKELLKEGLKAVSIVDINEEKGRVVQEEFRKEFGPNSCIFIKADVSESLQLEDAFKFTVKTYKHLDIVINNAGVMLENNWKKCLDINLGGCIAGTMLAIDTYLPQYKSGSEGVIVNVASVLGLEPWGAFPVYSATKQGIVAISRAYGVNEHYERSRVKVITLCPGSMLTSMAELQMEKYKIAYLQEFKINLDEYPMQEPSVVAKYLVEIIKKGQNGSVWVVEGDHPAYDVEFPDRLSMSKSKL